MYKSKKYILIIFISAGLGSFAQIPYLKEADRLFENYAYAEASAIYLSYLQQTYDYNANYKLAECYRLMNEPSESEFWYDILMAQPVTQPELYRNYADVLRSNGKYETAKENYLKYAVYNDEGYYFAGMCDWALANMRNRSAFLIDTISVNTTGSDMAPTFFKRGIIYSSNSTSTNDIYKWTGMPYYDLYYAEIEENIVIKKSPLEGSVNSKAHDASACYNPATKALYFTRNSFYMNRSKQAKDGEIKLELYVSYYSDNYFSAPRPLNLSGRSYSSGQPAISPDGTILIFASDKPGGYGGTDLYYAVKNSAGWSNAKNMGKMVNTPGDEMFPYISDDGKLYFSSHRHLGFGGLDVFMSERENDHWSQPVNLGLPVNSSRDDFAFIIKSGKGYVSSNREGGKGSDDIYAVTQLNPVKGLFVHDPDMKAISGAKVYYTEGPQTQVICVTDAYGFCDLSEHAGKNMSLKISREGFLENTIKNLNLVKTNNGIYPVEMQPLIGQQEQTPKTPGTGSVKSGNN